jgi:hypothetical protein
MNVYQKNYATKRVKEICNKALADLDEKYKLALAELYCKAKVKIADIFVAKLRRGKLCLGGFLEENEKLQQEQIDFIEGDLEEKKRITANGKYMYEADQMINRDYSVGLSVPEVSLADLLPGFNATKAAINKDFLATTKNMISKYKETKEKITNLCNTVVDTIVLGDDASQMMQTINAFEIQIKEIIG